MRQAEEPGRVCPAGDGAQLPISAELARLFERAPALAVVLRGPSHIIDYANPGYAQLMGSRALLGRPLGEAVPEIVEQGFVDVLDEVFRTGTPFEGREIEIRLPAGGQGPLRDGYYDFVYQPITGPDGGIIGIFAQGSDVTDRVLAERRLRESEARLANIFSQAMVGIAQTDLAGRFLLVNDRQCDLLQRSRDELLTLRMQDVTHPDDLPRNKALFEALIDRGEPFDIEKRYLRPDGSWVWVHNSVTAQRGSDGELSYVTAMVLDVTEAKLAEARQQLLINELNHRVKNTLATVQSLAAQAGRALDPVVGNAAFLDRLMALSSAHDVLTAEQWVGAELRTLVDAALAPFGGEDTERFEVSGPHVRLGPQEALAVSLALHELATNAVKYGALSASAGRVAVTWIASTGDDPAALAELSLTWRESGGPPVVAPTGTGFGSRLMKGLAHELGGTVDVSHERSGIVWRIQGRLSPASPPIAMTIDADS